MLFAGHAFGQACGDADGNGTVTVTDGVNVLRAAAGLPANCGQSCDVEGDGAVSVTDGVNVLRAAAGLSSVCTFDGTTGGVIVRAQAGRWEGASVFDLTEGILERGLAPAESADAGKTIGNVGAIGRPIAFGRLTRSFTTPYDVGGASLASTAGAEAPTLIVTVRAADGSQLDGFFELPLTATAADLLTATTFAPNVASLATFTLAFATRVAGVVGRYATVPITALTSQDRALRFGSTLVFDPAHGVPTRGGANRITLSHDGRHAYVSGEGGLAIFARNGADGTLTFLAQVPPADGSFPLDVVVSPDDRHVYALTQDDEDVIATRLRSFDRDQTSGALTLTSVDTELNLFGATELLTSPDGAHLYVVLQMTGDITDPSGAIAVYERDTVTGRVRIVQRVLADKRCAGATTHTNPTGASISPDGAHLYVTQVDPFDPAQFLAGSVSVFRRAAATGGLTFVESQCDGEGAVDGLVAAVEVATSPDGASVYVATEGVGAFDGDVVVFRRDGSSGKLAFVERKVNGQGGVDGLGVSSAITVSPDGARVYVTSGLPFNSGAVVSFGRNGESLEFVEAEFEDVAGAQGLAFANDVAASLDGAHVYVTGSTANSYGTVVLFDAVDPAVSITPSRPRRSSAWSGRPCRPRRPAAVAGRRGCWRSRSR